MPQDVECRPRAWGRQLVVRPGFGWVLGNLCRKDPISEVRFGFSYFIAVKCAEYAVLQS